MAVFALIQRRLAKRMGRGVRRISGQRGRKNKLTLRLISHSKNTSRRSQSSVAAPRDNDDEEENVTKSSPPLERKRMITGIVPSSHKIDISTVRVGQHIEIPYETTVTAAWREHWQSHFYQTDRMYTSTQFTMSLGFGAGGRIPMPFGMVLYLTGAMSHVDDTRDVYDISFKNCVYESAVFPGDTLRRKFTIDDAYESSDGQNVILNVFCEGMNQHDVRVFSMNKIMYFEKLSLRGNSSPAALTGPRGGGGGGRSSPSSSNKRGAVRKRVDGNDSRFRRWIIEKESRLPPSSTFLQAHSGDLLLHASSRPLGTSASMALSTQHRMTHPALFNTNRYADDELLVAGPCVIAGAHACASKVLYETVHEEIEEATFITRVNPNESLGGMTFIKSVTPISERLEEVECTTVGLKNVDVEREMRDVSVPVELFTSFGGVKPKDVNELMKDYCPFLSDKVVLVSHRKLLRMSVNLGGALL